MANVPTQALEEPPQHVARGLGGEDRLPGTQLVQLELNFLAEALVLEMFDAKAFDHGVTLRMQCDNARKEHHFLGGVRLPQEGADEPRRLEAMVVIQP